MAVGRDSTETCACCCVYRASGVRPLWFTSNPRAQSRPETSVYQCDWHLSKLNMWYQGRVLRFKWMASSCLHLSVLIVIQLSVEELSSN